jgi:rsbT antagonist protein RsbS
MDMTGLMGAQTILSGLRPGVVSALIDLGVEPEGLTAALNLDDAFELLNRTREKPVSPSENMDDEQETHSDTGSE